MGSDARLGWDAKDSLEPPLFTFQGWSSYWIGLSFLSSFAGRP